MKLSLVAYKSMLIRSVENKTIPARRAKVLWNQLIEKELAALDTEFS